jgi:hypothetical protein
VKLTEEQIEKLRQTGIRLDAQGRFWHEGEEVSHPGFQRALRKWLDILPDGRPILRLDERRYAYVEVEDAFLLVTSARWDGDRVLIQLNDESSEELAYDTLEQGDGDVLYCKARAGKLRARFTTAAYYVVAEGIEETAAGFALRAAGALHPIVTPR